MIKIFIAIALIGSVFGQGNPFGPYFGDCWDELHRTALGDVKFRKSVNIPKVTGGC